MRSNSDRCALDLLGALALAGCYPLPTPTYRIVERWGFWRLTTPPATCGESLGGSVVVVTAEVPVVLVRTEPDAAKRFRVVVEEALPVILLLLFELSSEASQAPIFDCVEVFVIQIHIVFAVDHFFISTLLSGQGHLIESVRGCQPSF